MDGDCALSSPNDELTLDAAERLGKSAREDLNSMLEDAVAAHGHVP
jgi:hypothetical protein